MKQHFGKHELLVDRKAVFYTLDFTVVVNEHRVLDIHFIVERRCS